MNDRYDTADDGEDVVAEYDTEEDELERNPSEQGKWTSLAVGLLGAWLIVSPWLFGVEFADEMGFNTIIAGAALAVLGGYNFYRRADERLASVAVAALSALVGLWLLVSPWVFELGMEEPVGWNYVVVGLLVAILGLYSSYEARDQNIEATVVE